MTGLVIFKLFFASLIGVSLIAIIMVITMVDFKDVCKYAQGSRLITASAIGMEEDDGKDAW